MKQSNWLILVSLLMLGLSASGQAPKRIRTYDLRHVLWKVSFDEESGTLFGDVTNVLTPLDDGLAKVELDAGPMTFTTVEVNGHSAQWRVGGEKLAIDLAKPASRGQVLKVRTVYSAKPEAGIYFVPAKRAYPAKGAVIYTQGEMEDTRYWLPTYDYPDDKATSEAFIEVPRSYTTISNGKLVETLNQGPKRVFHWKTDQPHSTYLISLVAGEYSSGKETWDGIPVDHYVPKGLEEPGRVAFGHTARMVTFYSELTGVRYPYAKFAQSAIPDYMFGGMENISAVSNTIHALHDPADDPLRNSDGLVLHELAHQWFGDLETCQNWSHIWLNEGFASFLPSFYERKFQGQDAYDLSRYQTFMGGFFGVSGGKPMIRADYHDAMEMFDGNAYPGGASRMFMLMNLLGETAFWKGIHQYLEEYRFKNANTEQFFEVMSRSSGKDLDGFRKQWFYVGSAPHLTVTRSGDTVKITQKAPYFDLDLPIWFLSEGKWDKKSVHLVGASSELTKVGAFAKKPLLIDPLVFVMGSISYDLGYKAEDWTSLYRHAPNAAQKARLFDGFGDRVSSDQKKELFREEKAEGLRERMMNIGWTEKELLELAKDHNLRIREQALNSLASMPKSEAVAALAREVFEGDASPALRLDALRCLYRHASDEQLLAKAWQMPTFDDGFRLFALDQWVQTNGDDGRERCLAILKDPPSEPLRVSAISHLGRLKDKPGERRVFFALAGVAREMSFGARSAAINALASYGDKAAIPYIEPATHHSLHFMRNTAKSALKSLQDKP